MKLNMSFLLLLLLVVSSSCAPFGFGAGVGGKSHTTWGADAEGTAGLAEDEDVFGVRGKARGGGYLKSVSTLTGGAYVASKDGTGVGVGGTSVFNNGVALDGGAAGRAGLNTKDMKLFGETKGYLDKEAHSNVGGNVDFYDAKKLKTLVASGPGSRHVNDAPPKKGRAFDEMGSSFDEW